MKKIVLLFSVVFLFSVFVSTAMAGDPEVGQIMPIKGKYIRLSLKASESLSQLEFTYYYRPVGKIVRTGSTIKAKYRHACPIYGLMSEKDKKRMVIIQYHIDGKPYYAIRDGKKKKTYLIIDPMQDVSQE